MAKRERKVAKRERRVAKRERDGRLIGRKREGWLREGERGG